MKHPLPVLLIRDILLFPSCEIRLEIHNIVDAKAIDLAEQNNNEILLIRPIDVLDINFDVTNLPSIGVLATIKMRMDMPNGKLRLVLSGERRVNVNKYEIKDDLYFASFEEVNVSTSSSDKAYSNLLLKELNNYVNNNPYVSNAALSQVSSCKDLEELTDVIASSMPLSLNRKAEYIQEISQKTRVKMLIEDINEAMDLLRLEEELEEKVRQNLDENQKEYILREKLKVIKEELGDMDSRESEVLTLQKKIAKVKCPVPVKEKLALELHRYEMLSPNSPESGVIRDYIDWLINLPWNKETKDNQDLMSVKQTLDESHFGLESVKERILEYLSVKQKTKSSRSPILCLVGPPGVGKTSLAVSIAKSLGRSVAKMSLGGVHDEAEIMGHRRTYIGAAPGRIIQGIRKAKSSNPVFIIDEIDKLTKDSQHDPSSALLEILDPEQNIHFSDHYIEEEFDLSKVFFIATANYIEQIPVELIDRLEIIEVSSYTEYEKLDISKNYLIPKELVFNGLSAMEVSFTDEALLYLIRYYTKEAGVRDLERLIASIFRKIVKSSLMSTSSSFIEVTRDKLIEYLGHEKYSYLTNSTQGQVGVVNGLSYTPYGGDILPIEVTYYSGKGELILTGSLGQVIEESARIAFSYIKSHVTDFGIDNHLLTENDIHIHLPEGAIKKEGPSAGSALTTALISTFTNQLIPSSVALTGEITLRGSILPVGGIREKVIGAHRAGVKIIYLPKDNEGDLEEVPNNVKKDLTFYFVSDYQEIFKKLWEK